MIALLKRSGARRSRTAKTNTQDPFVYCTIANNGV